MMTYIKDCLLLYALFYCIVFSNLYGQVETTMPDQPEVIIVNTIQLDAFQNLEAKNYELAIEQFDQLLKERPNYISALMGKAKSYLEFGQYQEAYDAYLKALEKDPSDHYSLEGLGHAAMFLNQADLALTYYKRALVYRPYDAQLYEAIAVSQICTNNYLNAAESAKMASLMYNKKNMFNDRALEETTSYEKKLETELETNEIGIVKASFEETVQENLSLETQELNIIKKALEKNSGKRKLAAKELGISERTLYRKIKQYDL